MDAKTLEMIRITARKYVQRCTPTCPSSTTCRYRHERKHMRNRGPCTRELIRYRRFVLGVTRGQTAFDLIQAAMDAALLDLLIDRCTQRLAGYDAFIEEANKANRPGPGARRPRHGVAQPSFRPEVNMLMRLIRRKHRLIDKCRALRHDATETSPPAELPLAQFMKGIMEVGKDAIYESVRHSNPETAESWTLPGDYPRNGKPVSPA